MGYLYLFVLNYVLLEASCWRCSDRLRGPDVDDGRRPRALSSFRQVDRRVQPQRRNVRVHVHSATVARRDWQLHAAQNHRHVVSALVIAALAL